MSNLSGASIYHLEPVEADQLDSMFVTKVRRVGQVDVDGVSLLLFTSQKPKRKPRWVDFLNDVFGGVTVAGHRPLAFVIIASFQGLRGPTHFAVTFGQGGTLLRLDAIDDGAGLRAAIHLLLAEGRAVNPALRRVVAMTAGYNTERTMRERARDTNFFAFGTNRQRSRVAEIEGRSFDADIDGTIVGKSALIVRKSLDVNDLVRCVRTFDAALANEAAGPRFDLLGSQDVDARTADRLDEMLIDAIRDPDADIDLWPPELTDATNAEFHFAGLGRGKDIFMRPTLEMDALRDVLQVTGRIDHLNVLDLRKRLKLVMTKETHERRFSLYRCFVGSIDLDGAAYVISSGRWQRVGQAADNEQMRQLRRLPQRATDVMWEMREREEVFCFTLAESIGGVVMDQKLVTSSAAFRQIELCDVISNDRNGQLILWHLKDGKTGQKLSHLFAQGTLSASSLSDPGFRREAAAVAREQDVHGVLDLSALDAQDFNPSMIEVVYAIGRKWRGEPDLAQLSAIARGDMLQAIEVLGSAGTMASWLPICR